LNIICFGDSITHGRAFAEGDRWPSLVQFKLNAWKSGEYKVYNKGQGGHTTAQGFDRLPDDVIPYLPGWLLVEFGLNDANVRDWAQVPRVGLAEYEKNLREFHRIAHAHNGSCAFIINHTILERPVLQANGKTYYANFQPYNEVVRRVAHDLGAPTIDLPRMMQERGIDLTRCVVEDGVHLTIEGNHLYADMVLTALQDILARYP
jgi:lysophospholipase L1-like esterase